MFSLFRIVVTVQAVIQLRLRIATMYYCSFCNNGIHCEIISLCNDARIAKPLRLFCNHFCSLLAFDIVLRLLSIWPVVTWRGI